MLTAIENASVQKPAAARATGKRARTDDKPLDAKAIDELTQFLGREVRQALALAVPISLILLLRWQPRLKFIPACNSYVSAGSLVAPERQEHPEH